MLFKLLGKPFILVPLGSRNDKKKQKMFGFEDHPVHIFAGAWMKTFRVEIFMGGIRIVRQVHPECITDNEFIISPWELRTECVNFGNKCGTCDGYQLRSGDMGIDVLFSFRNVLVNII